MYFSSNVIYSNVFTESGWKKNQSSDFRIPECKNQKMGNKIIKKYETNTFPISAFGKWKSEQYTWDKKWYEFSNFGSLFYLKLTLN